MTNLLMSDNGYPRRIRADLYSPAERAIQGAVNAVEAAGADVALTDAVILLGEARERVADYVDQEISAGRMPMPSRSVPSVSRDPTDTAKRLRDVVQMFDLIDVDGWGGIEDAIMAIADDLGRFSVPCEPAPTPPKSVVAGQWGFDVRSGASVSTTTPPALELIDRRIRLVDAKLAPHREWGECPMTGAESCCDVIVQELNSLQEIRAALCSGSVSETAPRPEPPCNLCGKPFDEHITIEKWCSQYGDDRYNLRAMAASVPSEEAAPPKSRFTVSEILFAAETIRAAVRDGIDELPDWFRVGFLSEEVAPMLDELSRLRSLVSPPAKPFAFAVVDTRSGESFNVYLSEREALERANYLGAGYRLPCPIDVIPLYRSLVSPTTAPDPLWDGWHEEIVDGERIMFRDVSRSPTTPDVRHIPDSDGGL